MEEWVLGVQNREKTSCILCVEFKELVEAEMSILTLEGTDEFRAQRS